MKRSMMITTLLSGLLTTASAALYFCCAYVWLLPLLITFATTFYHFAMRLLVGYTVNAICHNRIDCTRPWFRPRAFEGRLYALLRVRHWKRKMPTYAPDTFSKAIHGWEEIAGASCQAEVVHELIVILSFLPLAAIPFLGAPWVFVITSVLSAAFDLLFVCIQRYNRPMLLRQIAKSNGRAHIINTIHKGDLL